MKQKKSQRTVKKKTKALGLRRIIDDLGTKLKTAGEDAKQIATARFGTKGLRVADLAVNEVRRRLAPTAAQLHSWCEVSDGPTKGTAGNSDKKE